MTPNGKMLYFGSLQPFEHLLETSFEIFCAMVFVIHSYLFKPDHGHHHFSYLSCFSETIKPQHSQKQARVLCDWSSERTHVCERWLLYLCCTYVMPNTRLMSRLSCNRMETFIGTPVSWNTTFSIRSDVFHSGRDCNESTLSPGFTDKV